MLQTETLQEIYEIAEAHFFCEKDQDILKRKAEGDPVLETALETEEPSADPNLLGP